MLKYLEMILRVALVPIRHIMNFASIDKKLLLVTSLVVFLALSQPVMAQAPDNDIIGWPPDLLLIVTTFYIIMSSSTEDLWNADPSIGLCLWSGFPWFTWKKAQKRDCEAPSCHFVSKIRSAYGQSNFWINSKEVSQVARAEGLRMALGALFPVKFEPPQDLDSIAWSITSLGLLMPADINNALSWSQYPPFHSSIPHTPSARDFLLFAAASYHMSQKQGARIKVVAKDGVVFDTLGVEPNVVFDVNCIFQSLIVVAAHMGYPQKHATSEAISEEFRTYRLEDLLRIEPAYGIRFPLGAVVGKTIYAPLREIAIAYLNVVQFIKGSIANRTVERGVVAHIDIDHCQWIAIFGGAVLDTGRLTIQNLPGKWTMKDVSADEAFTSRIKAVLNNSIRPSISPPFSSIVSCGAPQKEFSTCFFLAALAGQGILCFFFPIGSRAGIWMSVAFTNIIFKKVFRDWHSLCHGPGGVGNELDAEPGLKMRDFTNRAPGFMCVATWDRSPPREKMLRPGFFLNLTGFAMASLGSMFAQSVRAGLCIISSSGSSRIFAAFILLIFLAVSLSNILITLSVWRHLSTKKASCLRIGWVLVCTLPSLAVLPAIFLMDSYLTWPITEVALLWISGIFVGMLENGRMLTDMNSNVLHLILSTRWLLAAIASYTMENFMRNVLPHLPSVFRVIPKCNNNYNYQAGPPIP